MELEPLELIWAVIDCEMKQIITKDRLKNFFMCSIFLSGYLVGLGKYISFSEFFQK